MSPGDCRTARLANAFHRLSSSLAGRSRGGPAADCAAPAWADPAVVESISLPLADRSGPPRLVVALRDGVAGRALPRAWRPGPDLPALPIVVVRSPRVRAQFAPEVEPDRFRGCVGTATALVRDLLAADRNYILTCGHVVAQDSHAQFRDLVRLGGRRVGYLAEWQPAIGDQIYRTGVDAALLEVCAEDAAELRGLDGFLPNSVGSRLFRDLPVTLRRSDGPLDGALKIHWSGYVDIPGVTPGSPDYFLTGAIGYATSAATQGGDSGAAVWDADESLMGMHIGALPDAQASGANAVFAPIEPVLEWFAVQPYTRSDPAALRVPAGPHLHAPAAAAPAATPAASDEEVSIVARTLWGEARGEGKRGMQAVASVILTRKRMAWLGARSAAAVCLARKQFSCWNPDDPNVALLGRIARAPDAAYVMAETIAREVVAEDLEDITFGATHYVATTLRRRPSWLAGKRPCIVIGRHEFYNDIS